MGWPPAVVIVVRHGARMDAADNQWHLTSPTPYDPPITYGGWNQSKALGARIASILRTRETDDELLSHNGSDDQGGNKRKRRHKVVIHTSPFLRCVQTSIALSAGLAQNPGHTLTRPSTSQSQRKLHSSPRVGPTSAVGSPSLTPLSEPVLNSSAAAQPPNIKKAMIRVDAFLGEWQNPEYFEQITPPPSSSMMIAGAKADLLRKEDYRYLTANQKPVPSRGFPGGWGSPVITSRAADDDLSSLSSLAQTPSNRDRTSSTGNAGSNGTPTRNRARSPNNLVVPTYAEHGIYQPPVPAYAISSTDPIPLGYVAHARDACVDVDYQWDSMRDPPNWGDGGEYGEEWSSMHRRFRNGLEKMISWYNESDSPGTLLAKTPTTPSFPLLAEDPDADTELVVILVSHGAGCNALIGALTNQPVLLDVGMASLTMAVRKPTAPTSPVTSSGQSHQDSANLSLSDQYDVKLVASTEHLRSAPVTPSQSRTGSSTAIPLFREKSSETSADKSSSLHRTGSSNGNFGSIRRAASVANPGPRNLVLGRQSSVGLWKPAPREVKEVSESNIPVVFAADTFANAKPLSPTPAPVVEVDPVHVPVETSLEKEKGEHDEVAPLGLWGNPKVAAAGKVTPRETSAKRRWTVYEPSVRG